MRIPGFVQDWLLARADAIMSTRDPDFIVGGAEQPYLKRWWIIPRNRWFNIYLHHFLRSDEDRALHDHMYVNASILLEGKYVEHTAKRVTVREAGDVAFRRPTLAHRVALFTNSHWHGDELVELPEPVTTLFITGPRVRDWGFHCPKRWVPWREFVDDRDAGKVGKGCDQ
jgi:hypothetical protein